MTSSGLVATALPSQRQTGQILRWPRKAWIATTYVLKAVTKLAQYCRHRPKYPAAALDYDTYWGVRDEVEVGERFRALASLIEPGAEVLDVGCGEGTFLEYLVRTRSAKAWGVDISEAALKTARGRGLSVERGDASQGELPDRPCDHVVAAEVLEHIPEPEKLLLAAGRRCRRSVVVSIPNVGFYFDRLRLLFGRFPVQWLHHPSEHLRFFTVRDFVEWANDLGFEVENIVPVTGFPVLMRWWPNLFAQQTVMALVPRQRADRGEAS